MNNKSQVSKNSPRLPSYAAEDFIFAQKSSAAEEKLKTQKKILRAMIDKEIGDKIRDANFKKERFFRGK